MRQTVVGTAHVKRGGVNACRVTFCLPTARTVMMVIFYMLEQLMFLNIEVLHGCVHLEG